MDVAEQLRLAVALAHALPDGALELHTDGGAVRRAAISPCDLRAALLTRSCPFLPMPTRVAGVHVRGDGLVDLGGGLYARRCRHGAEQRWFATFLAPRSVALLLDDCPIDMPDLLDASLRPDAELGVVVAVLSTDLPAMVPLLDEASRWASAACFTQELLHAAQHAREAP
jgi:hypothetical protein